MKKSVFQGSGEERIVPDMKNAIYFYRGGIHYGRY